MLFKSVSGHLVTLGWRYTHICSRYHPNGIKTITMQQKQCNCYSCTVYTLFTFLKLTSLPVYTLQNVYRISQLDVCKYILHLFSLLQAATLKPTCLLNCKLFSNIAPLIPSSSWWLTSPKPISRPDQPSVHHHTWGSKSHAPYRWRCCACVLVSVSCLLGKWDALAAVSQLVKDRLPQSTVEALPCSWVTLRMSSSAEVSGQ